MEIEQSSVREDTAQMKTQNTNKPFVPDSEGLQAQQKGVKTNGMDFQLQS